MNAEIKRLFADYLLDAKDPLAAAVLTLAEMVSRPTPEPIIVEPDDPADLWRERGRGIAAHQQ